MSFIYLKYIPLVLAAFLVFSFIYFKNSARFKIALAKYWALKPRLRYRFSHLLYSAFILLLLIATLDLRGPEETIEGSVSDQKTLIVIDTSSSMLAEDVRPNRFEKALMLAKHFVRRAYGHQVGIVVFSDIQKMLIPFTDDVDLLDARLGSLLEQRELSGGSNLYQTLREAAQYFVADGDSEPVGNILLISDAEAHDETFKVDIPEGINVAVIGVGTAKGAPIPIRENGGSFRGYKKFNGEIVNSSLNEELLKDLGKGIDHYKYWIVQGYSLPTEEILSFYNTSYLERLSKSTQRVRPVLGHYLVILAIICYILSVLFTRGKTFRPVMFYVVLMGFSTVDLKAQEVLEQMKRGQLDIPERLELARDLFDGENYHEAKTLYEETAAVSKGLPLKAQVNAATSKMAAGETKAGLKELAQLGTRSQELSPQELAIMRSNVLNAVKQEQEQQQQQKEQQQKDQQQKQGKGKGDNQQQNQNQQNKDQQKSEDGQNKQDQNQQDQQQDKGEKSKEEQLKEHQAKQRQQRSMKKVPALVKQVLEDDRKLQEEYWDTTTSKPEDQSQPKDW